METRNVLNVEHVDRYIVRFDCDRGPGSVHHNKWWASTFRKWLLQESKHFIPVVDERELRSPQMIIATAVLRSLGINQDIDTVVRGSVHALDVKKAPPWALKALEERQNLQWFVEPPDAISDMYDHWRDFCDTLPARDIRMTYAQMEQAVAVWDRHLRKQKLVQDLSVGVTVMNTQVFDSLPEPTVLVRLDTEDAYKAESAAMHHCVKTYWGREGTDIYSVRQAGTKTPLATIEVKLGSVEQIRGLKNEDISDALKALIQTWALNAGIKWFALRKKRHVRDEEDEDDYDGDEEEDEEDDDEDEEPEEDEDDGEWNLDGGPAQDVQVAELDAAAAEARELAREGDPDDDEPEAENVATIEHLDGDDRASPLNDYLIDLDARLVRLVVERTGPTVGHFITWLARLVPSFRRTRCITMSKVRVELMTITGIGPSYADRIADALLENELFLWFTDDDGEPAFPADRISMRMQLLRGQCTDLSFLSQRQRDVLQAVGVTDRDTFVEYVLLHANRHLRRRKTWFDVRDVSRALHSIGFTTPEVKRLVIEALDNWTLAEDEDEEEDEY